MVYNSRTLSDRANVIRSNHCIYVWVHLVVLTQFIELKLDDIYCI